MKKLLVLLLFMVSLCIFTGCNKQIFDFQYTFDKIYFIDSGVTLDIEKWTDYEDGEQLQVTLKDGTVMLVNSVDVILFSGDVPEELKKVHTIYIITEEDYKEAIKEL